MIERGGIRFGTFGLLDKEVRFYTGGAVPAKFTDPIEAARELVKILCETENVDVMVGRMGAGRMGAIHLSATPPIRSA